MAPLVPLVVQTAGVVDANVTGRCDVAVALTVTGDWGKVLFPGGERDRLVRLGDGEARADRRRRVVAAVAGLVGLHGAAPGVEQRDRGAGRSPR